MPLYTKYRVSGTFTTLALVTQSLDNTPLLVMPQHYMAKIKFVLRSIVVVYVSSQESDFVEQPPPVSVNEFCPVAAISCHGLNVVGIAPVNSLA